MDISASQKTGMIRIVIGPNGHGKTTFLNQEKDTLEAKGESVFFIPSEIKLLDEVKDTIDTSQTMEYLLTELMSTPGFFAKRTALYDEIDKNISDNQSHLNTILDEVLSLNGELRTDDFIAPSSKKTMKNLIKINQNDIKKKMGSGQRMQLLLKLAASSNRQNIFLDEPEKYSHPSLLNYTAQAINELLSRGKNLYVATHSPKLVSMLNVDYSNIKVINDSSHTLKDIPFNDAIALTSKHFNVGAMQPQHEKYYKDGASLSDCIRRRHNRQFIEALFTKRVYLCEGANDELLVNAALQQFGGYYDDYAILKVWGKTNLPIFATLFNLLDIKVIVLFDKDDEGKQFHKEANSAIRALPNQIKCVEQDPNLEEELCWTGKKGDALGFIEHLEKMSLDPKFNLAIL